MTGLSPLCGSRRQFTVGAGLTMLGALTDGVARRAVAADENTIRIGYISPMTGALAPFAEADEFVLASIRQSLSRGITNGERSYRVEILPRDDRSVPALSTVLADELIHREKVDFMVAQGPRTAPFVSRQCELNGLPCISTMAPWETLRSLIRSDQGNAPRYAHHFFWSNDKIAEIYEKMWQSPAPKRVIGVIRPKSPYGDSLFNPKTGIPAAWTHKKYTVIDIGGFEHGTADYGAYIRAFKSGGAEIVTGLCDPAEWKRFWEQSRQLGFHPKAATVMKALFSPADASALGRQADGMSTEIWWSPAYPFRSSLTGQNGRDLANAYTGTTGKIWCQPLGVVHSVWDVAIAALKASPDPKNPDALVTAIRNVDVQTLVGRLSWAAAFENILTLNISGGQWQIDSDGPTPSLYVTTPGAVLGLKQQRQFKPLA